MTDHDELVEAMANAIQFGGEFFANRAAWESNARAALEVATPVIERNLLVRLSQTWEAGVSQVPTSDALDSIDLDDWLLSQAPAEGGDDV